MKPLMIRDADGRLDPVYVDAMTGLWYFFEETWSNYHGPFTTEDDARRSLRQYCEAVLRST